MNDNNINNNEVNNVSNNISDSNKSKKIIIYSIIGIIVVAAIVVGIIFAMKSKDDKKDKDDNDAELIEISDREYQDYVDDYGRLIKNEVLDYFMDHDKYPAFRDIEDNIDADDIKCNVDINKSGDIKLSNCKIDGYKYNPDIKFEYISDNSSTTNDDTQDENEIISINIDSIDMNTKLRDGLTKPYDMEKLKITSKKINIPSLEGEYDNRDWPYPYVKYTFDNKKFSLYHKNGDIISRDNVNEVYFNENRMCTVYIELYLVSDNTVEVLKYEDPDPESKMIFTSNKYDNHSYVNLKSILVRSEIDSSCDPIHMPIGTDKKGISYNIITGDIVDLSKKYAYFDLITTDRDFNYNDMKLKVKLFVYPVTGAFNTKMYLVDSNNDLYTINTEGVKYTIKQVPDTKVESVVLEKIGSLYENVTIKTNTGNVYNVDGWAIY